MSRVRANLKKGLRRIGWEKNRMGEEVDGRRSGWEKNRMGEE